MSSTETLTLTAAARPADTRPGLAYVTIALLWLLIFVASLFSPPLLDDADATHASAARHILVSGDWVTLQVNGIRYLEKAPLPYWVVAASFRVFGFNTFAAHLPQAVAVLLLALLGFVWARRLFGQRAGLYTALALLTSAGVFLFTRIFIPEVWLSLFLCTGLYCFARCLENAGEGSRDHGPLAGGRFAYAMWVALALAVLTKGLVAIVFLGGTATVFLLLTGRLREVGRLRPLTGGLLFLAIAAPWHILAGLRNTGGSNGHGFFWFYFVNEHFLRFLGKRIPMDYNKLPGYLFWSLHLVWLFPWSLFLPVAWQRLREWSAADGGLTRARLRQLRGAEPQVLLLGLYATLILVFFSISTNQEYYTFPAYLPLLLLTAASLAAAEDRSASQTPSRTLGFAHAALTVIGMVAAVALAYGLWTSRHLPFVPDIGNLLAHRGVGDYTLSMSHLFDLTGPSFAALRLPAMLAALAFAVGPGIAWRLRHLGRPLAATLTVAGTSAIFLLAAHIAFARFGSMLSSEAFAAEIQQLETAHRVAPDTDLMLYGDQAYGSSIPFYLGRTLKLVDGRSSSMLFGSSFADAPRIFLTPADLAQGWGSGARKLVYVPLEKRDDADRLLGARQVVLYEAAGNVLVTDRPLDAVR